jgi:HPt (histidine-containing phosphotransfer) domain-containing protein
MASRAVPPYGVAIQQACASGDLERMRQAAAEAEDHIATYGDVAGKLAELKAEIAKLEAAGTE